MKKVRVIKFMGRHNVYGPLTVGRELEVTEAFFEASQGFLEPVDGSVGTSLDHDGALASDSYNNGDELGTENNDSDKENNDE